MSEYTPQAAPIAAAVSNAEAAYQKGPLGRVMIRIDSVHIIRAENLTFSNNFRPNLEWTLNFTVNQFSRIFKHSDVKNGDEYQIGFDFPIELSDAAATILLRVSGHELDQVSLDDPLPFAEASHGPADNWGIGVARHLAASNADFGYIINYTVFNLQRTVPSVIQRSQAIEVVKKRLEWKGVPTNDIPSEDELFSTFLAKIAARGMELKALNSGVLFWEGHRSIQQLLPEVFYSEPLFLQKPQVPPVAPPPVAGAGKKANA